MDQSLGMRSFQHIEAPLRLFQGDTSLQQLPRELDRLGCSRALLFCGRTLAADQALQLVRDSLRERCAGVFDGVRVHSPLTAVEAGAAAIRASGADSVIAVGGGSAIVSGRAATILAAEHRPAQELCTRRGTDGRLVSPRLEEPKLPQLVVLTTPTTACVKAGSAVTDSATGQRLALYDPKTRAQALFLHPALAATAPKDLVLTASLNTLAMAVEGLESDSGDPLSDGMLMQSLRLLQAALPRLGDQPVDPQLRADLMLAAVLCGQGTEHAGGGAASVLGHATGARFHLANGAVNAIVLPHTMRFNRQATGKRLVQVAAALGGAPEDGEDAAVRRVEALLQALPIAHRLRDAGLPHEALQQIARAGLEDWFLARNPRRIDSAELLLQLLQAAW